MYMWTTPEIIKSQKLNHKIKLLDLKQTCLMIKNIKLFRSTTKTPY